jgi:hypothetical protein
MSPVLADFKQAKEIIFLPSSHQGYYGYPVVAIVFDSPTGGDYGFKELLKHPISPTRFADNSTKDLTLFMFPHCELDTMDIGIVGPMMIIDVEDLKFDRKQLERFEEVVSTDSRYAFATAFYQNGVIKLREVTDDCGILFFYQYQSINV